MNDRLPDNRPLDDPDERAMEHFRLMAESVGVKRFAASLDISTRQVNRILAGAQPNPIARFLQCLNACDPAIGDAALDFLCQEMGGYFVREDGELDTASCNAVKECAEAIAAISDGEITEIDQREIREAISALIALSSHQKRS
ncbi:MAG: hypothetical protein KDA21_04470 [Phycisphaerales bacterium]|nr:hypothetical protein [Phycisphaerales bacterium]